MSGGEITVRPSQENGNSTRVLPLLSSSTPVHRTRAATGVERVPGQSRLVFSVVLQLPFPNETILLRASAFPVRAAKMTASRKSRISSTGTDDHSRAIPGRRQRWTDRYPIRRKQVFRSSSLPNCGPESTRTAEHTPITPSSWKRVNWTPLTLIEGHQSDRARRLCARGTRWRLQLFFGSQVASQLTGIPGDGTWADIFWHVWSSSSAKPFSQDCDDSCNSKRPPFWWSVKINDETLARQRMRDLLAEHRDMDIVGEAATGQEPR